MSLLSIFLGITLLSATIQAGVISGHYGGHLDTNAEAHDFSEGLVKDQSSNYESLGSLGDHLQESHFPSDYAEAYKGATEYEESAAASEHILYGGYEHQHYPQYGHESYGHEYHNNFHDFDSKPVPGINHGKGALSYSTTYEFKDPKP